MDSICFQPAPITKYVCGMIEAKRTMRKSKRKSRGIFLLAWKGWQTCAGVGGHHGSRDSFFFLAQWTRPNFSSKRRVKAPSIRLPRTKISPPRIRYKHASHNTRRSPSPLLPSRLHRFELTFIALVQTNSFVPRMNATLVSGAVLERHPQASANVALLRPARLSPAPPSLFRPP